MQGISVSEENVTIALTFFLYILESLFRLQFFYLFFDPIYLENVAVSQWIGKLTATNVAIAINTI